MPSDVNIPLEPNWKMNHKLRRQKIQEWLENLPKVPSHYCRASSKRVYVEATFRSVSHMYRIYESWCREHCYQAVSRHLFADLVEESNPKKRLVGILFICQIYSLRCDEISRHPSKLVFALQQDISSSQNRLTPYISHISNTS